MKNSFVFSREKFRRYAVNTIGAVAVTFGLMMPVLVGAVGVSVDMAQSYLVKQRLGHALDAAALAAAAGGATNEEDIEQQVNEFIDMNYPAEKIGATYDIEVAMAGSELTVSASAQLDTTFMKIFGYPHVTVSSQTVVQREVRGLEVALVLDNTGSMATNDNIDALRDASESFVNILFDRAGDPEDIRIGLVPYSNSVRIGRYGLGENPDGTQYQDGETFVTLPPGVSYTDDYESGDDWYGCVIEHMDNAYYDPDADHEDDSMGQLWRDDGNWRGHGWNPGSSSNDPYPQDIEDSFEGPWDIYMYGRYITNNQRCSDYSGYSNSRCSSCEGSYSRCNKSYCFCWRSEPNQQCPVATILPLTSDQDTLLARIEDMEPEGNTAGNVGMLWGWRLLSPEAPFIEGSEWESEDWDKAVIMMTDGDNTIDSGSSGYSYYGPGLQNNMTVTKMNNRFVEICDELKERDVLVYTVTFYSNIDDDTKDYYRECATDESKYFDAPSQEELISVFEKISRELSNLHIKQ